MPTYTDLWDAAFEAAPADLDNVSDGASEIRQLKQAVRERIDIFSRGGTLLNDIGGVTAVNIAVWRATVPCIVTAVKGYRVGGTGATVNARLNGASNHLATALSLTSESVWTDGGAVQNVTYAVGDTLEIMVVTVTGVVTQLAVQVDFQRADQ